MIVCADDFGMTSSINQAILELLEKERITSVSCMLTCSCDDKDFHSLIEHKDKADIGLHLTLTDYACLSDPQRKMPAFANLCFRSFFRMLDKELVRREMVKQITSFKEKLGFYPDYIDGHKHIQQLPVIRDILCDVIVDLGIGKTAYCRSSANQGSYSKKILRMSVLSFIKNYLINLPGRKTRDLFLKKEIMTNDALYGHYAAGSKCNVQKIISNLDFETAVNSMLYCHPEKQGHSGEIPWEDRLDTYNFLKSDEFNDLILSGKIKLNRFHINEAKRQYN